MRHPVHSLVLFLALSSTARASDTPAIEALRSTLAVEARHADDAWALSHALIAFGPDFMMESGPSLLTGLEALAIPDSGGAHYDLMGIGGKMGEMHPHLVFKTLAGEGLAPGLCGKLRRFALANLATPETTEEWNDVAWLIEGLARTAPDGPTDSPLRAAPGSKALAEGLLRQVEAADRATARMIDASGVLDRPSGGGDPAENGIWAYTCGGQHLIQGVLVAFGHEMLPPEDKPRLDAVIELFQRQVRAEALFRDREKQKALEAGVNPLLAEHNTMVQVLKLQGHALETLARAREAGIGNPLALEAQALETRNDMETRLASFRTVLDLAKLLPSVRGGDPATWRKWFGEGCHALHGLALWPDLPPRTTAK